MAYRAVLFDLGGVVLEAEADRLVHQVAQVLGRPFEEVHKVVYDRELLLPLELGCIDPRQYYEGVTAQLKLPWSYEQFANFWNDTLSERPDVVSILQRLREHHTLVALTNTNVLHLEYTKKQFPSLAVFHDWVASCEVGMRKPDPKIYQLAVRRAGVKVQEVVYVDDRPEMIEGGKAVGLTAIRFESAAQLERDLRALGLAV